MRSTGKIYITFIILRILLYFMCTREWFLHLIIHQNSSAYIETLNHIDSLDSCLFYSTSTEDPLYYWNHSPETITLLSVKDQMGKANIESQDFCPAAFSWPTFSPLNVAFSIAFICRIRDFSSHSTTTGSGEELICNESFS